MEELDSGDDIDTQGVGLISTGGRFASDPLRFTGIDLGEGTVRPRRRYAHEVSEDDESSDSDQDSDSGDEDPARRAREDELAEAALRRIRRAQAKGKQEVKLNKKELAALERRQKRMQAEASGENKKKKKEQRYAVPLSQLGPISQKGGRLSMVTDNALPQHPPPEALARTQGGKLEPPVGWFSHPSSRAANTDSRIAFGQTSDRSGSLAPFQYSYVQPSGPPTTSRHLSDPSMRPQSDHGSFPKEDARTLHYNASASVPSIPSGLDPFRYSTSGAQAPYHAASAAALRTAPGSSTYLETSRVGASSRRHSRHISPDATESENDDDEGEMSDEMSAGRLYGSSNVGPSNSGERVVVDLTREPTPPTRPATRSSKKDTSRAASPRRKSGSGTHGRRRKGTK